MHHPDTRAELAKSAPETGDRSFGLLPCPRCGEETTISVDLDDLTQFRCTGCDGEWQRPEVEALIAAWTPVLRWLDLAPVKE
jgi:hypothetical protein